MRPQRNVGRSGTRRRGRSETLEVIAALNSMGTTKRDSTVDLFVLGAWKYIELKEVIVATASHIIDEAPFTWDRLRTMRA